MGNDAIARMLENYGSINDQLDETFALKEILQQITLLGLHRSGFFNHAAFYGGTALRILYGLDRFSEDLDFCLKEKNPNFSLEGFLETVSLELRRYGFSAEVRMKNKSNANGIDSAFVKQNTLEALVAIGVQPKGRDAHQLLKIKLEVDKMNPPGANMAKRLVKLPTPFMLDTLDEPSLFAGKCHAILARTYQDRVKGRDYYDFLFYSARQTTVNLHYLDAKLKDSGHYPVALPLDLSTLKNLLKERFLNVDYPKAILDVTPFLGRHQLDGLDEWAPDLFMALADEIKEAP